MNSRRTSGSLEDALNVGDVQLRQLIDAMPHIAWIASAEHGCEFLSRRWEEITGLPSGEQLGLKWLWNVHPRDRKGVLADWRRALATGEEISFVCRIRRRDGLYHWFESRAVPLRNSAGQIAKWFATSTDVHEAYVAREALTKNEERLRYVELATGDCIYDWDIRNRITRRNDAFQKQFGAPAVHVSGEWWTQRLHPDDRDRVIASANNAIRSRDVTWSAEYRLRRPDDSYSTVVDRGYLLYDEHGKPLRIIGAIADITERKQIEQSLRDAQSRLLSAIEGGGMATWIWDILSDAMWWDEQSYRLWGRTKEELEPLTLRRTLDFIHPDDRQGIADAIAEFFRTGIDTIVEFRVMRNDNMLQWLQVRGRVERDASGKPIRMAGVYVDITYRKRTEEVQLRAQKMEALGTLAGGIAHDFNNILMAIAGNVRLALEDVRIVAPTDEVLLRSLEEIEKASARATDLVRRILTFSRQQETRYEAMQLQPLIEDALRLLRPTLPATIDIRTTFAGDSPPVSTDAIQIHQVVMNLVTNASHAIGNEAGVIEIELRREVIGGVKARERDIAEGVYASLTVRDTGAGISPSTVDRIFDPFFTTKQAGQGTGLGLAVVHGIVKAHGGLIDVHSEVGKGTTFRVCFPAAQKEPSVSLPTPAKTPRASGEHVLYVDDEEPLVFLVTRVLERLGYRVTGCTDPQEALSVLRKEPNAFDVLVTDLSMRGMNGFELARAAREIRGNLPVLLTSGYLRNEDRDVAEQCGIREMILKPNTVEELGNAIDRELNELRKTN